MRRHLVALACLTLLLAGCADRTPPPPPGPPTPGPVTSPPPAPLPPAANGDNVAACAQGNCEIRVAGPVTIPLDPRFEVADLRVVSVGTDQVVFSLSPTAPGWRINSSCSIHATSGPGALVTGPCKVGERLSTTKISIGVAAISQNAAVIRLLPL